MATAAARLFSSKHELSSFRVWMNAGASPPFTLRRLAVMALGVSALGAACLAVSCPYLLPAALFFGTWPLPFRCRVGRSELEVSWLFVRYRIPLERIDAWGLVVDPRPWVLGRRSRVLRILPRGARPLLLFAPIPVMRAVAAELQKRLQAGEAERSPA